MKQTIFLFIFSLCLFSISTVNSQTTVVLQPGPADGKDADVFSIFPNNNYGDRESITSYVWTYQSNFALKRFYLEFDSTAVPDGATIISAYLSLYHNPTDPYEGFSEHTGSNNMTIQRVVTPWYESYVSWDNQPIATNYDEVLVSQSASGTQDYLDIDVTNLLIGMYNPSFPSYYGFMIKMTDESNYYKSVLFASSDHANSSIRPKLVITYDTDPNVCVVPQNVSHELQAPARCNITWNTNTNALRYDVHYRVKGSGPGNWIRRGSYNNIRSLHYLQPNTTYEYFVRATCDGTWDFSQSSPTYEFNTGNIMNLREGEIDAFKLYPNPASDQLTIDYFDPTISEDEIVGKMYSVEGKEVKTFLVQNGSLNTFNIDEISAGIYIVEINGVYNKLMVR